jgi:predicted phage terminase large subunit-like protein
MGKRSIEDFRERMGEDNRPYREFVVKLPRPHPKQAQFVDQEFPRKIVRAGRRGGKTFGIALLATKAFLKGKRVLYAGPTSDQTMRFWELVKNFLGQPIAAGIFVKNENYQTIANPGTSSRIKAKTAWNADSLRGDYADLLILDEFQLMNESTWEEVGAPMLLDTGGDAVFIYTPPSIRSSVQSKARDKRHASKMFRRYQNDTSGRWATYTFSSHDNPFLDRIALSEITEDMSSIVYRQEILAEDFEEIPGALWSLRVIEETRVQSAPELVTIVVGVDPKVTEKQGDSETGIIAAGLGRDGHIYILADYSNNKSPDEWAKTVIRAYNYHSANYIVAEVNQGGALVKQVIRQYDKRAPIYQVRASRGKQLRAEPVSTIFEQGKAHIVGELSLLEEQMTTYVPGDRHSPDRLDAMVWACTSLMQRKSNIYNASQKYGWTSA